MSQSDPLGPEVSVALHFEALGKLLEPIFTDPKQLTDTEVLALASHLLVVIDFLEPLSPADGNQLRSMLFSHMGRVLTHLQVIDGQITAALHSTDEKYLIGISIPRDASFLIAKTVLAHQSAEETTPGTLN